MWKYRKHKETGFLEYTTCFLFVIGAHLLLLVLGLLLRGITGALGGNLVEDELGSLPVLILNSHIDEASFHGKDVKALLNKVLDDLQIAS